MQATYASKMDAVTLEYTHLLTSQLESQRHYFEGLREQDAASHQQALESVQARIAQLEADREQLQHRCAMLHTLQ